ncbi:MAG: hypothetical protein V3S83_12430 [Gemmatimonadota bacterium]
MNVYVVTAGDYSDYKIIAVFDSKEKAEQLADLDAARPPGCREIYEVEEYSLLGEISEELISRFRKDT